MEARVPDWAMDMNCAITVCDREGTIVYMNEPSRELYRKHGNLIGKNLIPCHGERSRGIIRDLRHRRVECLYYREKGVRKLIYQSAWRENGEVAGLVEFSIILPAEMPHYVRE